MGDSVGWVDMGGGSMDSNGSATLRCLMVTQVSVSLSAIKCFEGHNLPHPDITQTPREIPQGRSPKHMTK